MTRALQHRQPTVSLTITVNINADKTLLFLIGVIWFVADAMRLGSQAIAQSLSGSTESVLDWCEMCYSATESSLRWLKLSFLAV